MRDSTQFVMLALSVVGASGAYGLIQIASINQSKPQILLTATDGNDTIDEKISELEQIIQQDYQAGISLQQSIQVIEVKQGDWIVTSVINHENTPPIDGIGISTDLIANPKQTPTLYLEQVNQDTNLIEIDFRDI
jgi:hypothetical protein